MSPLQCCCNQGWTAVPLSTLHDADELVRWAKDRQGIVHKVRFSDDRSCCTISSVSTFSEDVYYAAAGNDMVLTGG